MSVRFNAVQPAFTGTQKVDNKPEEKAESKGNSTGAKVAAGVGLAALAACGIYFATKGKSQTVEAFLKDGGKFEKGKALKKDGKPYTGKLTREFENGNKIERKFKKGNLAEMTTTKGETVTQSKYEYDDAGKLVGRTRTKGDETVTKSVQYAEDGKLKGITTTRTGLKDDAGKVYDTAETIYRAPQGEGENAVTRSVTKKTYAEVEKDGKKVQQADSMVTTDYSKDGKPVSETTYKLDEAGNFSGKDEDKVVKDLTKEA